MAVNNRVWNQRRKIYIYYYDNIGDPDDTVTLVSARVNQKNRNFLLSQTTANSVDRLCSVPWIDFSKSSGTLAEFLRDRTDLSTYQRPVQPARINSIEAFWRPNNDNYLVNSVTIWIPEIEHDAAQDETHQWGVPFIRHQIPVAAPGAPGVNIEAANTCPDCGYIDPADLFFDSCPQAGDTPAQKACQWSGRPGEIVDGQHRIRGTGWPSARRNQPLPISLMLGNEFTSRRKAKIFKEITTNSEELHALHRLNLIYKFGGMQTSSLGALPGSPDDPVDFRAGTAVGRRNRYAYETATHMCQIGGIGSRWIDRIGLAPTAAGRKQKGVLILADKLVNMIAPWFGPGQPFDGTASIDAAEKLAEYLDAILSIWPMPGGTPAGGSALWQMRTGLKKKILQESPVISALLLLYPTIHNRTVVALGGPGPAIGDYENQLRYLEDISWDVDEWYAPYSGGQNQAGLLYRILHGLMNDCPVINPNAPDGGMGGAAIAIANRRIPGGVAVNAWSRNASPDPFSWGANTLPAGGFRAVSDLNPLILDWQSDVRVGHPHLNTRPTIPLNVYDSKTSLTSSYDGTEKTWKIARGASTISIDANTFTPGAVANVVFTLKYESSMGRNRTLSLNVPM